MGFTRAAYPLEASAGVISPSWNRAGDDTIALDDAAFAGLTAGALARSAFATIASATATGGVTDDRRILYDRARGDLYFDRDGAGGAHARVRFASVDDGTALTHSDFLVV